MEYTKDARFFLVQKTKIVKNVPKWQQTYQIAIKYTKTAKNNPNAMMYTKILHAKAFQFQSIPKKPICFWSFWSENTPTGNPGYTAR
jgi:hypothetical protein